MLSNARKYIPPCQSRFCYKRIKDIANTEYEKVLSSVQQCLTKNEMSIKDQRAAESFADLQQIIHDLYCKRLPDKLYRHARCEYKQVKRLQKLLQHRRSNMMICRVDKSEGFYIGDKTIMEHKTLEYMNTTEAYQELTSDYCPLADILQATTSVLDYFVKKNIITSAKRDKLLPNLDKLELPYLYPLPKIHKLGIPIRPIVSALHAPVNLTSKFLYKLLSPIYLQVAYETTVINNIDLIRKLENYTADGHLTSTTKFITADVENLYTMIPRDGGLHALLRFLQKYSKHGKIGPFSIDMIMKMARLILDNNYFAYINKYYKQTRGGAMGSAFTQVYANIYMLEWEENLIQYQSSKNEIYGRYIDDIFMTTNESYDIISAVLEQAQKQDVNIKINPTISNSVNFLDITINNTDGQLTTSIYHKPTADPYYLPYQSDHIHNIHRNIPYTALVRAARLCSNLHQFHRERLRIHVSLLLNGYRPHFISNHFQRFFQVNKSDILYRYFDDKMYAQLHRKLLYQTSKRKLEEEAMKKDPVVFPPALQQRPWNERQMYIRYRYESGHISMFPKEFRRWWKKHYLSPGSEANRIKLRLIPQTNRSLQNYLIRNRPSKRILKQKDMNT
ncbi:unnamed protein product [Rotaria sp. Silwood2]|nr:unnamed protein product [Rotaria sp. Silwood2]